MEHNVRERHKNMLISRLLDVSVAVVRRRMRMQEHRAPSRVGLTCDPEHGMRICFGDQWSHRGRGGDGD